MWHQTPEPEKTLSTSLYYISLSHGFGNTEIQMTLRRSSVGQLTTSNWAFDAAAFLRWRYFANIANNMYHIEVRIILDLGGFIDLLTDSTLQLCVYKFLTFWLRKYTLEEAFQQKWRLSLSMKISGGLSTFRESTHQLGNEYCSYQPGSQVQGSEVLSRFTQSTPSCAKETNII